MFGGDAAWPKRWAPARTDGYALPPRPTSHGRSRQRKSYQIDIWYVNEHASQNFTGSVVFLVANVSFETTEEQLRAVLSEVGPVVSLK